MVCRYLTAVTILNGSRFSAWRHLTITTTKRGDSRSSNKGPEPEALTLGQIGSRTYAFIGLERMGGIMVYDVTNPYNAQFVDYVINRDLTEGLSVDDGIGDLAPEGMVFVPAADSATGKPLLVVGNEVSGSVSVWQISSVD